MTTGNNRVALLGSTEFWETLNPGLTVTNFPFMKSLSLLGEAYTGFDYVDQAKKEGYFKLDPVIPRSEIDLLARAMKTISELGLPRYLYMYMTNSGRFIIVYRPCSHRFSVTITV